MTRNPRLVLFAWLACSIAVAFGSPVAADGPARRPNVLILLADDQRADTIARPGQSAGIRTPNLDRLAPRGHGVPTPTAWARSRGRSASRRGPCS